MSDLAALSDAELNRQIVELCFAKDYASDLNAAAELLREMGGSLTWDTYSIEWECSIPKGRDEYHAATHPTNPARAICEVWLAWKAAQKP
jgi:hypothetical protein